MYCRLDFDQHPEEKCSKFSTTVEDSKCSQFERADPRFQLCRKHIPARARCEPKKVYLDNSTSEMTVDLEHRYRIRDFACTVKGHAHNLLETQKIASRQQREKERDRDRASENARKIAKKIEDTRAHEKTDAIASMERRYRE